MDIKIKLVTIEERIRLQIEQALIKWVGDKIDDEGIKRKPKVITVEGCGNDRL